MPLHPTPSGPRRAAKDAARRDALIEALAAHVLAEGLPGTSLRPLARAAGTSNRMLLYYFVDKDELIAVTLERVADDLRAMLDAAGAPGARKPYDDLLREIVVATRSIELRPYIRLWLELVAAAARGVEPHRRTAGCIARTFVGWIESRLEPVEGSDRQDRATTMLATIDGIAQLEAVGVLVTITGPDKGSRDDALPGETSQGADGGRPDG